MHPVIQHGRGKHLILRILLLLQLHGRVQIDHQLQLQAVVQSRQAEIPAARFIVDDLHIHPVPAGRALLRRLPPGIHPVDPAPQTQLFLSGQGDVHRIQILQHGKGHFKMLRRKGSLFQLVLEGRNGALQDPLHAGDQMPVPGAVKQDRAAVGSREGLHRLFHQRFSFLLRKVEPGIALFLQLFSEDLQNAVEQISHIHRLEAVVLPLLQIQAVLQKMRVGAGGVLLQPADASQKGASEQGQGRRLSKRLLPVRPEGGAHHAPAPLRRFR